jgi:DNA-binding protein H-NS
MKKKYADQIRNIQSLLSDANLSLLRAQTMMKEVESRAVARDIEIKELRAKLETSKSINQDLITRKEPVAESSIQAPKKRGRKPGSKKPFYKKKSGGNPS